MPRIASLLVVLAFAGAAQAQAPPEPLVKKVKTSIAKGVAFLISQQRDDGGWDEVKDEKDAYHGGPTALALLALLNCDNVLDDPKLEKQRLQSIRRGLANLRAVDSPKVYVRALQTMALVEAGDRKKDYPQIKRNIDWLLEARVYYPKGNFIGWTYDKGKNNISSDASNSQYALLALWYGRQAGVPIDRKVWVEIRDYFTRTQDKNGFWIYSFYYNPNDEKGPSQTMTVAGLCGLLIAGTELNGDREPWPPKGRVANCGIYPENPAVLQATRWINKNFTLELNHRTFYHLYGLERAGRLSGLRFFGQHDWYREGSEFLTKTQRPDGSWQISTGRWDRWPHVNTSFALLFLSKGRTPVLISKLVHGNFPRRDDDTDWNNDRHDLKNLTEYLATQRDLFGKKPLAWQTYDILRALYARNAEPTRDDETAIVAEMRQTPILYITGHQSPSGRIQEAETALIKRYVENGGFILAEACCSDPNFDRGIKKWVKDTWDTDLQYVQSTHPVWTCFHSVTPGDPFKLMKLELGCRTVMLYSPQDLSCHWESNRYKEGPTQRAFELGANIVVYVTGKTPPPARGAAIDIPGDPALVKPPRARGAFQVMQVNYSDQWQPAPKAMTNLMEHVHKVTGLDVKLKPGELLLRNSASVLAAKFLYLHGKGDLRVNADIDPLRFTLQNGGLLFADACCGDPVFDKAFRKFARQLFPKEKLVRVPFDENERDRLFSAKLNDGVALTARNIQCRTEPNGKIRPMEPFVEGIKIDGRWVVLYSKYDIGCALERSTATDCVGYDHDSALRISTAAVRYNARP